MKHKTKKLAQIKQLILSIVVERFLFPITFKRVPKKQFGRCVNCGANKVCHKYKVCKCTNEQQYDIRVNML